MQSNRLVHPKRNKSLYLSKRVVMAKKMYSVNKNGDEDKKKKKKKKKLYYGQKTSKVESGPFTKNELEGSAQQKSSRSEHGGAKKEGELSAAQHGITPKTQQHVKGSYKTTEPGDKPGQTHAGRSAKLRANTTPIKEDKKTPYTGAGVVKGKGHKIFVGKRTPGADKDGFKYEYGDINKQSAGGEYKTERGATAERYAGEKESSKVIPQKAKFVKIKAKKSTKKSRKEEAKKDAEVKRRKVRYL